MRPTSVMLDTYRQLVAEARARVDAAMPEYSLTGPPDTALELELRGQWRTATTALEALDANFDSLSQALFDLYTNRDLNDEARRRHVEIAIGHHRTVFEQERTVARDGIEALIAATARATRPARPQPEDALQEARIGSIKADLAMLLANRTEPTALASAVGDYLAGAIAGHDDLAAWVVAGSGWLDLYIRGRAGDDNFTTAATVAIDAAINAQLDARSVMGEQFDARPLYRILNDPQRGGQSILTVLAGFGVSVFNDLATWRLLPVH